MHYMINTCIKLNRIKSLCHFHPVSKATVSEDLMLLSSKFQSKGPVIGLRIAYCAQMYHVYNYTSRPIGSFGFVNQLQVTETGPKVLAINTVCFDQTKDTTE